MLKDNFKNGVFWGILTNFVALIVYYTHSVIVSKGTSGWICWEHIGGRSLSATSFGRPCGMFEFITVELPSFTWLIKHYWLVNVSIILMFILIFIVFSNIKKVLEKK